MEASDTVKKGAKLGNALRYGDIWTRLSFFLLGLSNIVRGQIAKGLAFLGLETAFITYMARAGMESLKNMATLGTREQSMVFDEKEGIFIVLRGDNSMLILLYGVVAIFVILFFVMFWISAVKSGYKAQLNHEKSRRQPLFGDELRDLLDGNLHKTLLFLPVLGLVLFTVVPLLYMILMAFTNYDVNHQPPGKLFDWVGLQNFHVLLNAGQTISKTFWPVLGWTMIWAVFATFTNYIFGMLLAILINSKGISGKKIWRTIFVITIAVPAFATLLGIRLMLGEMGAINILLQNMGLIDSPLPFLTDALWAKVTVIIVNMWVGIPHTMLITTGILMNIPADIYESARIDGANAFTVFRRITLPYMIFVTTPYLITQFIANINNFSVIYFLTRGNPISLDYFKGAGKTDLLVTWLYKLTRDSKDYNFAATIGIIIFIISATFSIIVYRRSNAFKNEEALR